MLKKISDFDVMCKPLLAFPGVVEVMHPQLPVAGKAAVKKK